MTEVQSKATSNDRRALWQIFTAAFIVRVLYILLAHTFKVRPSDDHFEFGWEMGRIGRALATGHGYADPFTGHTGPTAWVPPGYTLLVGGVFRIFGVYSKLSAFVLLTFNSLLSALTAVFCYEIGLRCFNRRVALWSGWLWALYPAAMQYAVRWIWEMTTTTCIFTALFVLTLRMRGVGDQKQYEQTWQQWAAFGLLWGVLAMVNPSPLIMLPVMALYILAAPFFSSTILKVRIGKATLAAVLFLAVIAPWTARNYAVFHRFIPLRDNFGAENYEGNSDWSTGFPWGRTVPLENHQILAEYARMGEPAWAADRAAKANAWIKAHPGRFAKLSMKRAWMYWMGVPKSVEEAGILEYLRLMSFQFLSLCGILGAALAVRRRKPAAWVFLSAFLLLPLPYYLVTVQARFRHTLEPLICILGVYLFQSATHRKTVA
ncbi:ArnT family glycosyltransferase [Terriglobus sp. RCC_193]|uniref:ArnT family glycosyltransferase n=1 Tax=Terriglobus sp. RCC_193 TaxID=3239218 RepID=UPI003525CAFF